MRTSSREPRGAGRARRGPRSIAFAAVAGAIWLLAGGIAGATLSNPNPPSGTAGPGQSASTSFSVFPQAGTTVCVDISGTPARTHPFLSQACGDSQWTATLRVSVDAGATPGSYGVTLTEQPQDNAAQVIQRKSWTLVIPAPAPTTSSATTTTRPVPTTVSVAAPTTVAETTTTSTEPPTTTTIPDTTTRHRRVVAAPTRAHARHKRTPPWLIAAGVAALAVGAAAGAVRKRRPSPAPALGTTTATAARLDALPAVPPPTPPVAGTTAATATGPLATGALAMGAATRAGLAFPVDSVTAPWGRPLPLLAAAAGPATFTWYIAEVQGTEEGRWVPWPPDRARGGLRIRHGEAADGPHTGAQALLLHPFLAAVGDVALVKLSVAVDGGGEFPAWLRAERSADWEVSYTVVHAPGPPEPSAGPPPDTNPAASLPGPAALDVPPGPLLAGERMILRAPDIGAAGESAVFWKATAGTFPVGASGATVVYEAPSAPGTVELSLVGPDGRAVASTTRTVAVHPVVVVAGLRGERAHRLQTVLAAAGHEVHAAQYDWRQDPASAAGAVSASLEQAREHGARVTVVAHGTGGLVLSDVLANPGDRANVDDAVFVGTPHHGLPAAFRWLRFGNRFGPLATSRLADAFASTDACPMLYAALPGRTWFAGAGPLLHDRTGTPQWITDAADTYTAPPGLLPDPALVRLALERPPAPDLAPVRAHAVAGRGIPTECLYSYGLLDSVVTALADPLAAHLTGALQGTPEVRSFIDGAESLVVTLLDGDGVVPTVSATGALQPGRWLDQCHTNGVAHEDLLDDTSVLAYVVYVAEHLR